MSFGPFNGLLSLTSALVLASQSLPALSKTPTPPSVPNNKICAAVILKDDREGAHSDRMQLTIRETLREAGLEEQVPVFVTSMNKKYDEEQEIIKEIPENVPVFVNQSFGFPINSKIVETLIIETILTEITNNQKPDSGLFKNVQDLLKQYPRQGEWNLSDVTLRDIERKYPDIFNFFTQTVGSPNFNNAKHLIKTYYNNGQWDLTLGDIREDPFVRPFVEDAVGGFTTIQIDNFLSDHPNVTIFNAAGNGPNNQGTAQGGPPTVFSVSLIPKSLLPNNRFFMVAVGNNKGKYDNTAGSYLPSPGNPDRLPVVFQKPTNRTVEGPFYDGKKYYVLVDFNGNRQPTTPLNVSEEDVIAFRQSGQPAEVFFGISFDDNSRLTAVAITSATKLYYNLGPNGSTSTATAQTTAQAAVAACQNPNALVIPSLFDRIR
jgi:hypothetical protein